MKFSVENVCGFLIRSRLMTPDEMKAMYQRWQTEAGEHVASSARFSRWLVVNHYVTEYQASLLLRGHADGFYLNHYKVLERVGRGRMAGVYRALHPLGQIVAVKVLPPSRATNPQTLGRFKREADLSLRLNHPNVVRSFQMGSAGDLHYLVMEYLEGATLDDVIQRRKRLPPGEAVRLVHQALQGLQHIHEQGMVHRDLKPANLMLTWPAGASDDETMRATLKILDIGLGRQLYDENHPDAPDDDQIELTKEGVILGTPDYLAPEQARDPRTIDIRADIYSLGCVLYHALSGTPPFPDRNILSQMVKHARQKAPPLRQFNPEVPDGLQQIVDWMMAKKPEERYPTPARAAQALELFLLADSEPIRRLEDAPQMRTFLTWLEQGQGQAEDVATVIDPRGQQSAPMQSAPMPAPVQPAPVLVPVGKSRPHAAPVHEAEETAPVMAAASSSGGGTVPRARRRSRPVETPAAATAQRAPAAPIDAEDADAPFDIERSTAQPVRAASRLSARAWLVIGIAGGASLMLALVAVVLILAFSS